jgi:hypothetical protein
MVTILWILAAAAALAFAVVMTWKTFVGWKEEDVIILDPAEQSLENEQRSTVALVVKLTTWAKGFGFTALAMLVLIGGISLYNALHAFGG